MSLSASDPTVFLARQPIYDRRLKVHAYELLFRRDLVSGAGNVGPEESAATIIRAIVEIGLDKLVGEKPAYINIPDYLLADPALFLLPKERVVLEILEDTEPTLEALAAAEELCRRGYKIALDDFVFGSPQIEFLPFAKIVKLDLLQNQKKLLPACVAMLRPSRVRLLAEKVETMEMFASCQALGCHYFQGYFCAKPEVVMGRGVPAGRAHLIAILNRLQDPSVSIDELERLVSSDVALAYRLLRLVNTVCIAAEQPVDSVRSALVVLGLERVCSLVSLLALAGVEDKPIELLTTAMVRAKMCEGVAEVLGFRDPGKHFTVGLLSVLDAMFDMPMSEILEQMPLANDVKEALSNPMSISPLTETFRIVLAFETGQWESFSHVYAAAQKLSRCYVRSVQWADQIQSSFAA